MNMYGRSCLNFESLFHNACVQKDNIISNNRQVQIKPKIDKSFENHRNNWQFQLVI